jgi:hypothetical protein
MPDAELTRDAIDSAAYCSRGHLEYYHPERTRDVVSSGDIGLGIQSQLALILSGRNIGYVLDHTAAPFFNAGTLRALRPDLFRLVNPVTAMIGPGATDFKLARRFVDCLVDVHMGIGPARHIPRPAFAAARGKVVERDGIYHIQSVRPDREKVMERRAGG